MSRKSTSNRYALSFLDRKSPRLCVQNARSIPYKVILVIPPGPEPNPSQMRSINCYNGLGLLTNGTVKVPLSYGS